MLRKTLLALGVAAILGLSLQVGGRAEASASSFTVNQGCSETGVGVDARINWQGNLPGAKEIWFDLSEYNNGWIPDSFATSGAISPNQSSFKWVSLLPNTTYFVRVSQLLAPGYWDSSATYVFVTGPSCFGVNMPSFSTPWYYGTPYGTTATYATSSSPSSSYSLQPIDAWVNAARIAQFIPSRFPNYYACYPYPETGCHFP